MKDSISLDGAVRLYLTKEHRSSIVTLFDIGAIVWNLYHVKRYDGKPISRITASKPRKKTVFKCVDKLLQEGVIEHQSFLDKDMFVFTHHRSAEELVCSIDPFCYLSHISAMQYHGLTNILPKILYATTYEHRTWNEKARSYMESQLQDDASEYFELGFPQLIRRHPDKIGDKNLNFIQSKQYGSYIVHPDTKVRVASVGRTFLDALKRPELCGGMSHVLDMFEEHGATHVKLIVNEVDRHGSAVDKMRAGYILEEICHVKDNDIIQSWVQFAQRGGSRKLDPHEAYWNTYSEKWMISINA